MCAFCSKFAEKKDQIPEFFLEDENDRRTAGCKTTRLFVVDVCRTFGGNL